MSLEKLKKSKVWVRAKDFALRIYKEILALLPAEEKWNLGQQLRRSALSIPANIAEGHGRYYYQDNVRFCYNARGSLSETLSHVQVAFELGYIPDTLCAELESEGEDIEKMLNGYILYLKRSKQGQSEPGANYTMREEALPYAIDEFDDLQNFEDTPS